MSVRGESEQRWQGQDGWVAAGSDAGWQRARKETKRAPGCSQQFLAVGQILISSQTRTLFQASISANEDPSFSRLDQSDVVVHIESTSDKLKRWVMKSAGQPIICSGHPHHLRSSWSSSFGGVKLFKAGPNIREWGPRRTEQVGQEQDTVYRIFCTTLFYYFVLLLCSTFTFRVIRRLNNVYFAFSHHWQGSIDFNTVRTTCPTGMYFLIHPQGWINDERMAVHCLESG